MGRNGDRVFYLVGAQSLQNKVMGQWLHRTLSIQYEFHDDPSVVKAKVPLHEPGTDVLILVDAASRKDAGVLVTLNSSPGKHNDLSPVIALFNVPRQVHMELRAFRLGVSGFFYVDDSPELLLKGVTSLFNGEKWISREVLLECATNNTDPGSNGYGSSPQLTDRETEILVLLCEGMSNEEIAEKLFISIYTVKTHLYNVFKKINVPNRLQAAFWGAKHLTLRD